MEFFHLVKASQKSGKPSFVFWFTAKTEARAKLQAQVILEDNDIEVGRGQDYQLPILTNLPVVDDLPEEEALDFTWCERYALGDDGRTWLPIVKTDAHQPNVGISSPHKTDEQAAQEAVEAFRAKDMPVMSSVCEMPFRHRVIAEFLADNSYVYFLDADQKKAVLELEMDVDNGYVQNLILATENESTIKGMKEHDLWKVTDAVKAVFPVAEKKPELGTLCHFIKTWLNTPYIDRGLLVKEWSAGRRVSEILRTDSGTNAGGGNKTDRNPDYLHTLDTLDIEIAAATLPMDFDIYEIPVSIHRRAKEIVTNKESPFKEWSQALRASAGILDYSRAAIFALIRSANKDVHHYPTSLQTYISANLTEHQHDKPAEATLLAAAKPPKEDKQPEIANLGAGIFSIDDLVSDSTPVTQENTPDVQMEETVEIKGQADHALSPNQGANPVSAQADTVSSIVCTSCGAVGGGHCPDCGAVMGDATYAAMETDLSVEVTTPPGNSSQNNDPVTQSVPDVNHLEPNVSELEPESKPEWPEYFEPGRYEGLPNEVYHASNGVSSTQVKDARVSLMYFNARHVAKTIQKERSPVLDMGNLVHALALQPESLEKEFSVEPEIPEGAFTTTATVRTAIDAYNAALPAFLSADDIKALIEEYNATLPPQVALGGSAEETGQSYMSLPAEFQRIEEGQKQTIAAMKACIKEYNATLPPQVKTSGSRDALLEQLAIINPDLVAQEAQKAQPLKVSGTKTDLIQSLKAVNPSAVFADELLDAWRENPEGKVLVTRQQLSTALAIQKALLNHPTAGKLLTHPSRAVEVSYFGIDEETGLEVRVRPDLEIDMGARIGADLKTISMWNIKQEGLRARLHREIIDRDYHLSAAMYCETAALDQFFWIFVNKDENYHWITIIEASAELLELGMLEYRKAMRAIAHGFDTGEWPAPIVEDYSEELNDFDMRRLEALRGQA